MGKGSVNVTWCWLGQLLLPCYLQALLSTFHFLDLPTLRLLLSLVPWATAKSCVPTPAFTYLFFILSESQSKNQKVYYLAIPEDKYSSFWSQVYIACEDFGINTKYLAWFFSFLKALSNGKRGIINTKLDIALWSQAESTYCFYAQTVLVSILKFVNALGKYPGWFKQGNLYSRVIITKLSLRKCFERIFF